ncbi:MAG: helix-turn-helix domain-containing protein [Acidobacteriaceae bacterium]|jgi:excisionase family DNA binding protein
MNSKSAPLGRIYSIPEAAPTMGLKPKGLWGMVARQEIETIKIGRLRKISERAIQEYLERNTSPAMRDCM